MATGYYAVADLVADESGVIELVTGVPGTGLDGLSNLQILDVCMKGSCIEMTTRDFETEENARAVVEEFRKRIHAVVKDVTIHKTCPSKDLSWVHVFSTVISSDVVDKYIERARTCGFPVKVGVTGLHDGTNKRVQTFLAYIGPSDSFDHAYEKYNRVFLTRFRYDVHGDDPLPSYDGGYMPLRKAEKDYPMYSAAYTQFTFPESPNDKTEPADASSA